MFKIYSLGEGLGDCFLIEIGKQSIRILVDGRDGVQIGEIADRLMDIISKGEQECVVKIDILIVTHIDQDHIKGIIKLMKTKQTMFSETIIVYNYVTKEVISYRQAEEFEDIIKYHTVISTGKDKYLNISQENIKIYSIKERENFYEQIEMSQKEIPVLTFISPNKNGIDSVYEEYKIKRTQNKEGNEKKINRNSIVFLLEYNSKCALFAGDAYIKNIEEILSEFKKLDKKEFNVIKLPHHGAKNNNTGIGDFAKKHHCSKFIVTGESDWANKKHPHKDTILEIKEHITDFEIYTKVNITYDEIENNIKNDEVIDI